MPRKDKTPPSATLSSDDEHEFKQIVKGVALDSHARAEVDFLARLRTGVVAVYTGTEDRHMNGHIAEFLGVVNADALVFVDRHRNQDRVERTFQNLPTFDRLFSVAVSASRSARKRRRAIFSN